MYLLLVVAAEVYVMDRKLSGFEEISSSRCVQYILKLPESNSEESYDPIFTHMRIRILEKKRGVFASDDYFKIHLIM